MSQLTADVMINLLEEPIWRYPIKLRITEEATTSEVVLALKQATDPLTRQILCDIAGDRFEQAAVPTLIQFLNDPSSGVRASVGDALGKIADPTAGPALFERFAGAEKDEGVLTMLALALGSTRYRPTIPLLVKALDSEYETLRDCSAWGLGLMGAIEAIEELRNALAREERVRSNSSLWRFRQSLEAIELANAATSSMGRKEAIKVLLAALKQRPHVVVRTTSALWALGKLRAREAEKSIERLLLKYPKGFLAEHSRAALDEIRNSET